MNKNSLRVNELAIQILLLLVRNMDEIVEVPQKRCDSADGMRPKINIIGTEPYIEVGVLFEFVQTSEGTHYPYPESL